MILPAEGSIQSPRTTLDSSVATQRLASTCLLNDLVCCLPASSRYDPRQDWRSFHTQPIAVTPSEMLFMMRPGADRPGALSGAVDGWSAR